MTEAFILLDKVEIQKKIKHKKLEINIFPSIDSTNEYLKNLKATDAITFCLAEQQIEGRGRLNRKWHSPFGQNIYLSCLYPLQKNLSELTGLSLVISLAIMNTLKNYHLTKNIFVKWPNDIIYLDQKKVKKLSGCLIEIYSKRRSISDAVIGVGINVNMLNQEDQPIDQAWTSMREILGVDINRNELCACLIDNLLDYLSRFNLQGLSVFTDEWKTVDYLMNQVITLNNANQKITGKVLGIDAQGYLILELPTGKVSTFSSGDTSIEK